MTRVEENVVDRPFPSATAEATARTTPQTTNTPFAKYKNKRTLPSKVQHFGDEDGGRV